MNQFSSALQRSRKSVMASATVLAMTILAFTVPVTLHGGNGKGNAYGKNKHYPYRVSRT